MPKKRKHNFVPVLPKNLTILFNQIPDRIGLSRWKTQMWEPDELPEINLLRAMLERAIIDLFIGDTTKTDREDARFWIQDPTRDHEDFLSFAYVCHRLNISQPTIDRIRCLSALRPDEVRSVLRWNTNNRLAA